MSLIYENSSSFDMKKKLECDIHKQKLIIVDLCVKLLQWISRDTSMLTIPNLNTKLSGWNQLYHTRSFYISFLQLLIIKFQILNHFWKCICTRKSHQNLHALLYGATIGWFFNSLTDWTDFLYYAVLMCVLFFFLWFFFWFNFCVLVNCIQVLVKKHQNTHLNKRFMGHIAHLINSSCLNFFWNFWISKSLKIW